MNEKSLLVIISVWVKVSCTNKRICILIMSSILLNNFPKQLGAITSCSDTSNIRHKGFTGFSLTPYELLKAQFEAFRKLFANLLLHDVLYIRHEDYLLCIKLLGHENVIKLLESGALKVIFDSVDFTFVQGVGRLKLQGMTRLAPLRDIVEGFSNIQHENPVIQSRLRYLTDENHIILDRPYWLTSEGDGSLIKKIIQEVTEDRCLSIKSHKNKRLSILRQQTTALRTCEILLGYSLQHELKIGSISQDAYSKEYMAKKILVPAGFSNSTDCFESLMRMKGIPDLLDLYVDKIITFDDILAIRESAKAKVFRQWMYSQDYDREAVVEYLLKPCKPKIKTKLLSFIYPNVVGLINPIAGIAASAVDSFLVDLVRDNWNPKVFLDEELAKTINTKLSTFNSRTKKKAEQDYVNLSLTDPCYCGSKKTYAKCCGR